MKKILLIPTLLFSIASYASFENLNIVSGIAEEGDAQIVAEDFRSEGCSSTLLYINESYSVAIDCDLEASYKSIEGYFYQGTCHYSKYAFMTINGERKIIKTPSENPIKMLSRNDVIFSAISINDLQRKCDGVNGELNDVSRRATIIEKVHKSLSEKKLGNAEEIYLNRAISPKN